MNCTNKGSTLVSTEAFKIKWTTYGGIILQVFDAQGVVAVELTSGKFLNDNAWHHVLVTLEDNRVNQDGVRQNKVSLYTCVNAGMAFDASMGIHAFWGSALPDVKMVFLGKDGDDTDRAATNFKGMIAAVSIYSDVLMPEDIERDVSGMAVQSLAPQILELALQVDGALPERFQVYGNPLCA